MVKREAANLNSFCRIRREVRRALYNFGAAASCPPPGVLFLFAVSALMFLL